MSITTGNSPAFINAEQYSSFVLTNLNTMLLPEIFYRNVADFGTGTTLNIKTVGARTLQDVTEDEDLTLNPIDSSTVTLTITDHVGDAVYVTDEMKEDGDLVERLLMESAMETQRLIKEDFQASWLQTAFDAQTDADPNAFNGFAHRITAAGGNDQITEGNLIDLALAFDEANVPQEGRILIVPPVVTATFNKLVTLTAGLDRTPMFQTAFESGFAKQNRFIGNIHGWDIYQSNLAPPTPAGAGDGTTTVAGVGRACVAMCIADDNCKPLMAAWRRLPKTEARRDPSKGGGRDEFYTTARWGHGVQREDTLGIILVDATATA